MPVVTCHECGQSFSRKDRDERCPHCGHRDHSHHRSGEMTARRHREEQVLASLLIAVGLVLGMLEHVIPIEKCDYPILAFSGLVVVSIGFVWLAGVRLAIWRDRH